ncbi:MAG TPA: AmmeMemoRadiSam system protein B [Candidatus Hydrogenedentes bacterium]|nr:AmmeMemoRadiSam system protein B [Candidatus Hydrogenedentota bacterium]
MRTMNPYPPLRNVDVIPAEHKGQPMVCLYDTEGYVEEQVALSPQAFFIAACLDGQHDAEAIQNDFARQFGGVLITTDQIDQVAAFLDEKGFLYNDHYFALKQDVEDAFRAMESRPAFCAGRSYPEDPKKAREFLNTMFAEHGGPLTDSNPDLPPLRCLITPHIDFARGAAGYAQGYRRFFASGTPDIVFIFGVAHRGGSAPFVLTSKDFETPLGTLKTNREIVERLAAVCEWDPFEWEPLHRNEHSIEFQALMLAHRYGTNIQIVPILCSGLSEDPELTNPASLEPVSRFLTECRAIAADSAHRVSVIAGADLAHVGRHFEDDIDITQEVLDAIEARDREDLAHVLARDPEHFYASVMKDKNQRKVCGLSCIYAAMKAVEGLASGSELLHYGYAPDPVGGVVSFASIAIQ